MTTTTLPTGCQTAYADVDMKMPTPLCSFSVDCSDTVQYPVDIFDSLDSPTTATATPPPPPLSPNSIYATPSPPISKFVALHKANSLETPPLASEDTATTYGCLIARVASLEQEVEALYEQRREDLGNGFPALAKCFDTIYTNCMQISLLCDYHPADTTDDLSTFRLHITGISAQVVDVINRQLYGRYSHSGDGDETGALTNKGYSHRDF